MFLNDLIQRAFGEKPAIAPRRASRFEPAPEPVESAVPDFASHEPPRSSAAPPPNATEKLKPQIERTETRILERLVQLPPPQEAVRTVAPMQSAPLRPQEPEPPEPAAAAPLEHVAARIDLRRETAAPVSIASTPGSVPPLAPPPPAVKIQTREVHDRQIEVRTVEQRLEELVREKTVQQVERVSTPPVAAARDPGIEAQRPVRELPPRLVEPRIQLAPRSLPERMEMPGPEPSTEVHITIGRVEVKAATLQSTRPSTRNRGTRVAKSGLEEYLERRERS